MLKMMQRWGMSRAAVHAGWATTALFAGLAGCGGGGGGGGSATDGSAQSAGVSVSDIVPSAQAAVLSRAAVLAQGGNVPLLVTMDDTEALVPFSSWSNVKRDYGAVGDGVADDTVAIQKALDDLGWKKPGVFLPAGKYRITRTLRLTGSPVANGFGIGGVSLVGQSPDTTQIVWAGTPGDPMLVQDGGSYTRFSRITWDGKGTAGYGVAHWWNAKAGTWHDSSPEHTDEVFKNMKIGIMAGRLGANYGQLDSEGQVRRVQFINISQAGLNTGSWNAMNWWIWDSRFTDCARGVSNIFTVSDISEPGAGSMHVYRSLFERSTVADINIGNTGTFSMHQNVSVGSRRFFQGESAGNNGASILLKGNRVLDTTDPVAIANGNLGPIVLLDNSVRSASGNTSPAVLLNDFVNGRDVVSVGNRYTVGKFIQTANGTDRAFSQEDTQVSASAIASDLPVLPATPTQVSRQVFEVPAGASDKGMQDVIDRAAAAADPVTNPSPIVHFAPGTYKLSTTLVVPAGKRIQIVGDGMTSLIRWAGASNGIMFQLNGPTQATVRDLQLLANAPSARAFSLPQADQVGGRVVVMGSTTGNISGYNVQSTQISLQANGGVAGLNLSNVQSFVSIGAGGVGPTVIRDGTRALVADLWYEGSDTALFRITSGDFTYMSGHMSPASHAGTYDPTQPPVSLDAFSGKATFLSFSFDNIDKTQGVALRTTAETGNTSALFLGASSRFNNYLQRSGTAGKVGLLMSRGGDASGSALQLAPQGTTDTSFVNSQLLQARSLLWETSVRAPTNGVTDARIYRVHAAQTLGMIVSGN